MSFRLSDPLNLEISSGSKRDSQDSVVECRGGNRLEGLEQQKRQQNQLRFEGAAAIGRANSSGGSNSSGGYRSAPHHSSSGGDARLFSHHSSSPTTSSTNTFSPEPPHANATMTDRNVSDIFGGFPAHCGGGGGVAQHMVVPSFASRRPQWAFSSTESASSNGDHFLSSSCMDYCCTSESAAEPSHRCDPNYSFLHPHHQQQQQVDLSTRPTSPRVVAPLSAARDAPGPLPSNEDRQCVISAQQQGIAYSPAAAADQDFFPLASTIPNSWNKNPSPASSLRSYSSTQGSNLSSETEFGGGGAPITPEDFDGTLKNKHLSSRARFSYKSTETPDISEDNDEDHSDGGIAVDHSDSEMSSGPVQVLYSSSVLRATAMDEDEDDFSPNNLVTRPPSPVGGGGSSFFMDIFSSPSHERPPEIANGASGPYMQLDTLQNGFGPISNFADVLRPSVELLDSRSQSLSTPSTPSDIIIDPLSPNTLGSVPRDTDGFALVDGEDDELFVVESNYSHPTASMPSQSSSQSPPTAAVAPPAPPAAAVVAASGIMMAVAGVGGVTPFPTHASPTLHPPHPPLPPPLPPHVSRTPSLFLPLDVFVPDGGSISEEDEFDDITNHTFEHILALEDIENYNFDFSKFCTQAYYRYRMNSLKFPKLLPAAMDVKNMERPQEVTREDMQENGGDYQGISWEKLGITGEAAREIRRKEYVNYRNIKGVDDENPPVVPANRDFFKFRRMDTEQRCRLIHFQLRNLLGVVSRNDVFYAGDALVLHTNPLTGKTRTMMDLRTPDSWSGNPIRISTLGACGGSNGVVIAGCFHGEYAMKPIHATADSAPITGIVTKNESGITNHVQMIKSRTTGTPNAVFSSNDFFIRVLNCGGDMKFLSEHEYNWPVNCSVTSPDSRLRVVVGDDMDVLICDAERGSTEFVLSGHRDFGFAAAWSDDGYTIATGNQDKTVRIFDARNLSKTVKVLPAVMAGVRTLRFSPIGNGGKRVLAMAEPGDVVQIVDAVSWDSLQQIDFWGEVGGIDFDPSGEEFYIVNADKCVGGVMEFSRSKGTAYYESYGNEITQQRHRSEKDVMRRRRKRSPFIASSDEDSSTAFSDEDLVEDEERTDTRERGKYYDSRRYKRLGHDMSSVFV